MGGMGSGSIRKNTSPSEYFPLDMRLLKRHAKLAPGQRIPVQWLEDSRLSLRATVDIHDGYLAISFASSALQAHARSRSFTVSLARTTCFYGGSRHWFLCPNPGCRRRAAILYIKDDLACRKCRGFSYETQRIAVGSRAFARAQTLRLQLGGSPELHHPFPAKPRRMHEWTYTRRCIKILAAELRASKELLDQLP